MCVYVCVRERERASERDNYYITALNFPLKIHYKIILLERKTGANWQLLREAQFTNALTNAALEEAQCIILGN